MPAGCQRLRFLASGIFSEGRLEIAEQIDAPLRCSLPRFRRRLSSQLCHLRPGLVAEIFHDGAGHGLADELCDLLVVMGPRSNLLPLRPVLAVVPGLDRPFFYLWIAAAVTV